MPGSRQNGRESGPDAAWAELPAPFGFEWWMAARLLARAETLAGGAGSLVDGAKERAFERVKGPFRGEEAETALLEHDDAGGDVANFDDGAEWAEAMTQISCRRLTPASNSIRMGLG